MKNIVLFLLFFFFSSSFFSSLAIASCPGAVDLGGYRIIYLATPTDSTDAIPRYYAQCAAFSEFEGGVCAACSYCGGNGDDIDSSNQPPTPPCDPTLVPSGYTKSSLLAAVEKINADTSSNKISVNVNMGGNQIKNLKSGLDSFNYTSCQTTMSSQDYSKISDYLSANDGATKKFIADLLTAYKTRRATKEANAKSAITSSTATSN